MPGLEYQSSVAARDALTKSELARISKLYTQWADEIAKQAEYFSKLKSNYASTQARQLDTLKKQLESSSITVTMKSLDSIKTSMTSAAQSAVTAQSNWLRSLGFKVKGIDVAFSDVPSDVVEKLVTGSIYKGGWNLSDAIWGDNEDTLKKLYEIVAGGVAQNKSTYDITKDLEQFVRPGAKKNWNLRDKDGRRIYPKQVDYNAQRLARTLTQHAYQQGTLQAAEDNPFITSFKWVANGSRRCDICKKRDGRVYKKGEVPLDHPNGMCIIVPVVEKSDDEITDDLAAWVRGEKVDPEIDKFAKKFGYSGSVPSKQPAKQPKVQLPKEQVKSTAGGNELPSKYKKHFGLGKQEQKMFDSVFDKLPDAYRDKLVKAANNISKLTTSGGEAFFQQPGYRQAATLCFNMKLELKSAAKYGRSNPFSVFYHELGHAIDFYGAAGSRTLSGSDTFIAAMRSDFERFSKSYRSGEFYDGDLFYELSSIDASGIQDIFSGARYMKDSWAKDFTDLSKEVKLRWGHSKEYWTRSDIDSELASELFAHISSAMASQDEMGLVMEAFPNAVAEFKKLLGL